jgi:hypothetical protein
MCRCPTERKYLMVWSNEDEMNTTLQKVRDHCSSLKTKGDDEAETAQVEAGLTLLPPIASGVEKDLADHKDKEIKLEPYDPNLDHASQVPELLSTAPVREGMVGQKVQTVIDVDDDDDDIEIIAVRSSGKSTSS